MQREPPKSCSNLEIDLDRISNLPNGVTEKILSLLSTREVVRTSVLSSKWRYKWAMLPHLVFDEQSVSSAQNHNTFVKVVDHVLLLHNGPIHKVKLSHPDLLGTEDIDRWILHLSRNSIKEFRFDFRRQPPYKMPSCFFSCKDMVHLDLCNCLLKPPSSFRGFKSLENLKIEGVTLTQDDFEKIIVCCPLLKSLTMLKCLGFTHFTHLKIDAPNLQCFFFQGVFKDLNLENSTRLRVVSINKENSRLLPLRARFRVVVRNQMLVPATSSNLLRFSLHLHHVRTLHISGCFLKYLAVGACPEKLPKPCLYLHTLDLRMNFNDNDEFVTALCLLRSSPALQNLDILSRQEEPAVVAKVNSWLHDNQNCPFTQLRLVKITGVSDIKAELDFISFLLSSSPVLERMTITAASVNNSSELLKKLIQLKRASAHAVIIYLDNDSPLNFGS